MHVLCNLLIALMDKSAEIPGNNDVVLRKVSKELRRLCDGMKKGYTDFALIGKSNVGKSTVINALLGEELAPRKNKVCTAAIVEYRYAESYSLIIKQQDDELISLQNYDSNDMLLDDLKKNATVTEESAISSAERTIVKIPSAFLKNRIVIFDTPGFGATIGGTEEENSDEVSAGLHDSIVEAFLNADECLNTFWIIRENLSEEIKDLMSKYCRKSRTASRHFMIVNTRDLDDEFIDGFKQANRQILEMFHDRVYFVNAKLAVSERGEAAEKLRQWILQNISVSESEVSERITDLLRRMSVQCREVEGCSIKWSQVLLARVISRCNEKNLQEVAGFFNI